MSRLSRVLRNDLQLLHFAHDELALQAHLLRAEVKQRWHEVEAQWADLKERTRHAEAAGEGTIQEVEAAASLMVESLKKGFADIKRTLGS